MSSLNSIMAAMLLVFGLSGCADEPAPASRLATPPPSAATTVPPAVREIWPDRNKVGVINPVLKQRRGTAGEYVTILGARYEVPRPWKGHRMDLASRAENGDLVNLDREFSFEESRIYVTTPTRDAFEEMARAAREDGVSLTVDSGFRSISYQRSIFIRKLEEGKDFQEIAKGVAPPGYSEHMTGTAVDLVPSDWTFHGSRAEAWLLENGHRFNFVQTYTENNRDGFVWEPWHWRHVDQHEEKSLTAAR